MTRHDAGRYPGDGAGDGADVDTEMRAVAYRVRCPGCGDWAQLRWDGALGGRRDMVAFSCRNQTSAEHVAPSRSQLVELLSRLRGVRAA